MLFRKKTYRSPSLIIVWVILLLVALFFFPLWGQGLWLPYGGGDSVSFLFPMYRFVAASFAKGQMPLWNPTQYAGYPLIADNQAGMFYPPNLLLFLLKPTFSYVAMQWLVALHIFWAGVGMFVCARGFWDGEGKIGRIPAITAATAFMFSDLFITHIGNLNLIAVASWLPWAFWTLHRSLVARSRHQQSAANRHLLTCGVIIGVSTLAGHAQMTFFIALMLGVYALWRTLFQRDRWALPSVAAAGLIGIGLSILTLLPALEMNPLTRRGAFSYAESVNYSIPWQALVGLIAPDFYGRGAVAFWGGWDRVEVGYMGILPLLLIILSLVNRGFYRKHTERRLPTTDYFFLFGTLLFFLLALGGNTPFHRLILGWAELPFQVPARFVLLMNFCMAMSAAVGMQRWMARDSAETHPSHPSILIITALIAAISLFWLGQQTIGHQAQIQRALLVFTSFTTLYLAVLASARWKLPRQQLGWALFILLTAELFVTGQYVEIERNNPLTGYENDVAIEYLQQNTGINRIDEATAAWQPSAAQIVGLYSAGGVFNPLELATHAAVMGSVGYRGSPVYSLMGIKYIVADKQTAPGDTAFLVPVANADPTIDIYLNTNALPRVMMLYKNQVVESHDAAFAALHSGLDFTETVIVEQGEKLDGEAAAHQLGVIQYDNNRVVFDVMTEARGYLLLTDMFYPNWRATVDGNSAEILRANYAFRAILLEAGQHRVEMSFTPTSWQIGWKISLATFMLVLTAYFILWRQSQRTIPQ
ncbi:MAG: YfhO family protein [Candidatus Promineifilaceae bacterium]